MPLPDMLVPILRDAKKKGSLYVCPSADGQRMTETAWNTSWNSYLHFLNIQAGGRDASRSRPKLVVVDRFTAHQLRHTYDALRRWCGCKVCSGHAGACRCFRDHGHIHPSVSTEKSEGRGCVESTYYGKRNSDRNERTVRYGPIIPGHPRNLSWVPTPGVAGG